MLGVLEQRSGKEVIRWLIKVKGPKHRRGKGRGNRKSDLGEVSVMAALRGKELTKSHIHYENPGTQHSTASSVVVSSTTFTEVQLHEEIKQKSLTH